jgi:hypothetical protein
MSSQEDFKQELALWESAGKSSDPNLTIRYLEKYPSGYFNQVAEVRLDELLAKSGEKKIQIKGSIENPFSKGTVSGVGKYFIGDSYTFEKNARFKDPEQYTDVVTSLAEDQVIFNNGERVFDLLGNETKAPQARFLNPIQFYPAEYTIGNKWSTKFGWINGNGQPTICNINFAITQREKREVSFGTFNCFHIEAVGVIEALMSIKGIGRIFIDYWIDPENCYRPLEYTFYSKGASEGGYGVLNNAVGEHETITLKSYKERRLNSPKT